MRNSLRWLPVLVAILACAYARADRLADVLAQMDKAGKTFQGMQAQLTYTKVTVVVDDHQVKNGGIRLQKDKKGEFKILINFKDPDNETVLYKNGQADVCNQNTKKKDHYDLKEHKEEMDQFLQLGFGSGSATIQKNYDITMGGDAKVNNGDTVKLELTPKKTGTGLLKVELWISQVNWLPVQQRFTQKSKDYTFIEYRNIQPGEQTNNVFELKACGK